MTNNYKIARFATLLLVFFAFLTQSAKAQLFTDQFNYTSTGTLAGDSLIRVSSSTPGTPLTGIWKGHSNGGATGNVVPLNPQLQTATSLTYATYPTLGGAVSFINTGLDVNASFASQTSGSVYASAIVSLSATQTAGDYFFHLGQTSPAPATWNVTSFTGRVFAKSSGTGFVLGFTRGSAATAASYGTTIYPFNTPIFIVIKHNIVTGATNDTVAMYVFTTGLPPAIEPTTPDFTDGGIVADPTEISKIAIRQGTAASAPTGLIDYVRVGTVWADVTSFTAAPAPTIAISQGGTGISTNNSAFAMGSVATSTNLDVTFTITNGGTALLTFTAPVVSGVNAANFSILTPPTSPVSNTAPNTTTFVIRFFSATPITSALGTVTIANNAGADYVVNLSANAAAAGTPSIAITQGTTTITTANSPAFPMGSIALSTDLDVTFTITNAGTAPLTFTAPVVSGANAASFIISTLPVSPVNNVAPNNTTTFVVRFNSATAITNALGTVTIANNAGTDYVVNLSANATAPVVGSDYEPFNQASGFVSTTNGWVAHGGTGTSPIFTQQTSIATGSLLYSGLATPTGNKISIVAGNTEDINKVLSAPLTTDAYYSALLNVPNTTGLAVNTANGDYFLALGGTSGSATISILTGRFFIRQGSTAGTFNLGVLNNSGGTAPNPIPTYSTTDYATSTTYFIAVKYNLATNTASLWINPATGLTTEPTTTLNSSAGTNTAPPNLVSIVIRQGGSLTPVAPATTPSSTGNIEIDEIRVGATWASVTPAGPIVVLPPSLTATPTTLAFGNVIVGATPAALSYSLSGANLTNPVTVTAPASFQIATSATGTFGATLTFTVVQMATAQTIFVKPTSTATLGALSGNITHASTGVTTAPSVAVSGTIINSTSIITAVLSVADFGVVNTGAVSTVKTFAVQGTNLTADLVVTAPTNFQVSKDGNTFSTSVSFTALEVASINGKDVFVRFAPTSGVSGLKDVVITSSSTSAISKTTSVKGTENSPTTALDNSFAKEVVIYPNPAQTSFQIKLPTTSKNYSVEIVDISGKVILTNKSDEIVLVENLQKGFYLVRFSNAERTFTKKISIN